MLWLGALCGVALLLSTAWMSDDAYITLRTIDNFWNGYGLRWNTMERVQPYTHPLWLMLVGAAYGITREPFLTTIAVSFACAIGAVAIVTTRIAGSRGRALAALGWLLASKAFVEFSSSGLENPLTHLVLALFCWEAWTAAPGLARPIAGTTDGVTRSSSQVTTHVWRLSLLAALCALNRIDLLALVGPMMALPVVRALRQTRPATRVMRAVVVGLLPIVAWELFSIFYYGFALPNTAYAKLATGIPRDALLIQGLYYLRDSLIADPVTLPTIAGAIAWSVARSTRSIRQWHRGDEAWSVGASLTSALVYIVFVGGDFMSGRFLSPPFLVAVAWLCRVLPLDAPVRAQLVAAGLTLVSVCAPQSPWRFWRVPAAGDPIVTHGHGIADERALYYPDTGLLPFLSGRGNPARQSWAASGAEWRAVPRVAVFEAVGLLGYYAGPGVHIIDPMGLTDPLLAKRPVSPPWRIGHFRRELPDGYVATVERCLAIAFPHASVTPRLPPCVTSPQRLNAIRDPQAAALYDRLALITQAPLLDPGRLRAIVTGE